MSRGVSTALRIGDQLRPLRRARGLSLRALGERAGVSAATLSQIETGKSGVRAARVLALADALGVEPGVLVPGLGVDGTFAAPSAEEVYREWRVFAPLEMDPALGAALECFNATGYHGASVRDVAGRAGLSVPGLYHYYPSKQAMLGALLELGMTELLGRATAARAEGDDPVSRFALVIEALTLYHAHRPELSFLGISELRALSPDDRRVHARERTRQQEMVDAEVEAGVAAGLFGTPTPHSASRAAVTMCVAVANWYRHGGALGPEEVARQYVGYCLDVVRCEPVAARRVLPS